MKEVFISTAKQFFYQHNLKSLSARKPLLQNCHKKARLLFATVHGDSDLGFGEMASGLMKQKWNHLPIMTNFMFGGKMGSFAERLMKLVGRNEKACVSKEALQT